MGQDKLTHDHELFDQLTKMIERIHATAVDSGRYKNDPQPAPLLMHIVGETNEACEAMLTGNFAHEPVLDMLTKDWHLETFEKTVKNTVGDELSDIIILAMSISKQFNVPLEKHLLLKMRYNAERSKHSIISESYSKT